MTATTVGYGDQFPVTMGGRIVGVVMLTVGVALFATFSSFLANAFLSSKQPQTPDASPGDDFGATLVELERLQEQQQRTIAALRARLVALEPATRD